MRKDKCRRNREPGAIETYAQKAVCFLCFFAGEFTEPLIIQNKHREGLSHKIPTIKMQHCNVPTTDKHSACAVLNCDGFCRNFKELTAEQLAEKKVWYANYYQTARSIVLKKVKVEEPKEKRRI